MVNVFLSADNWAVSFPGSAANTPLIFFLSDILILSSKELPLPITVLSSIGLSKTALITVLSIISTEPTVAEGPTTSIIIASFTILFAASASVAVLAAVAIKITFPGFSALTIPLELLVTTIHDLSPPARDQ